MPFESKAQMRFLYAKHPEVAESFSDHTPKSAYKKLPEYVSKDKNGLNGYSKKHRRPSNERKVL